MRGRNFNYYSSTSSYLTLSPHSRESAAVGMQLDFRKSQENRVAISKTGCRAASRISTGALRIFSLYGLIFRLEVSGCSPWEGGATEARMRSMISTPRTMIGKKKKRIYERNGTSDRQIREKRMCKLTCV